MPAPMTTDADELTLDTVTLLLDWPYIPLGSIGNLLSAVELLSPALFLSLSAGLCTC